VAEADGSDEYHRDAKDLRRGALVNSGSYLLKLVIPLGTAFLFGVYGEAAVGVFAAAQAALLLLMRIGLMGLDKAMHWWIARQPPERERVATRPVLAVVVAINGVTSLALVAFAAPWVAQWKDDPSLAPALRYIALALVPMAAAEIFIGATLGKRRMEGQVLVKDAVVPVVYIGMAFALGFTDATRPFGLPLAYMLAQVAALATAVWYYRRVFAASPPVPRNRRRFPREMLRYALPMWGTEVANGLAMRIDVLLLGALMDEAAVGIYHLIQLVGNSMRAIRRAFDPIVLAIVSRIGAKKDLPRLRVGVSYATSLVVMTQAPVYAFIIAFAPNILLLIGDSFDAAVAPVIILAGFWSINGILGLQLIVVMGYGRSDWSMINLLVALAVQVALLWVLIPPYGLVGAAVAVGVGTLVQNVMAVFQARSLAGGWAYEPQLGWLIASLPVAGCAMWGAWLTVAALPDLPRRIVAFVVWTAVQGGLLWTLHKTDRLVRPISKVQSG
jgi:O-antigen/teichoic acid export membrane protein